MSSNGYSSSVKQKVSVELVAQSGGNRASQLGGGTLYWQGYDEETDN